MVAASATPVLPTTGFTYIAWARMKSSTADFRTLYRTNNGVVQDVITWSLSGDTTVNSVLSGTTNVIQTNLSYTSAWFINSNLNSDMDLNGLNNRNSLISNWNTSNVDNMSSMFEGATAFNGNISNLWYYSYALGTSEIQSISKNGPNTEIISPAGGMSLKNPNYLSLRWFFFGAGDMFNPNIPQSTQQNS